MIMSVETFLSICWLNFIFIEDVELGRELVCFLVTLLFLLIADTQEISS